MKKSPYSKSPLFRLSLYLLLIGLFLGLLYVVYLKKNSTKVIENDVNVVTPYGSCASPYESKWGEWCVYTWTDAVPDKVVQGFENIYHPSVFFRNGKWIMLVGGWKSSSTFGGSDRVFRFETSDPYALGGWNLVKNPNTGSEYYIDTNIEDSTSYTFSPELTNLRGNSNYVARHVVQPSFFPYNLMPGNQSCCDTIFYSHDLLGVFPEKYVSLNWVFIDPSGKMVKAGRFGGKNPLLSYTDYWNSGIKRVESVSDGNFFYDTKTKSFYMVYTEVNALPNSTSKGATIGLSRTNWPGNHFTLVKNDLLGNFNGIGAANPQILLGPDNRYYLFYVSYRTAENQIRVAFADNIAGPYAGDKIAVIPPTNDGKNTYLTTPFVFCNTNNNRWQMFFSYKGDVYNDHQIYSAFLEKNCSQAPY